LEKIGKYQILERLGQGGMGVVYKALDPLIERTVALKVVSAHLDADPESRARFFREGRSAGQLSHKNIVTIFDLGEDNGMAYLAMELLEGEDLRAKISRGDPLSVQQKIEIMMEICEGLAHAHDKNVIHRDIKPANIFITKTGVVKVLDFGLARTESSDLTTSRHAMGTPNYMSPEQVRGEKVDYRTDIFSAGVLFYELLTYRKAFQGNSFVSTVFKILEQDPEPIDRFEPAITPRLSDIVFKALQKDRELRYQALRDMLRDLREYLGLTQTLSSTLLPTALPGKPAGIGLPDDEKRERFGASPAKSESRAPSPTATVNKPEEVGPRPRAEPANVAAYDTNAAIREDATVIDELPQLTTKPGRRVFWVTAAGTAAAVALAGFLWMLAHQAPRKTTTSPISRGADVSTPAAEAAPPPPPAVPNEAPSLPDPDRQVEDRLAAASTALEARKYSEAEREAEGALKLSPGNPRARSLLSKARESLSSIGSGVARAKALLSSGDYPGARAAIGDVLALSPSDAEARRLQDQLNQITRREAERAQEQMRRAKSEAVAARAADLAPQPFGAAKAAEENAGLLYARGNFEGATSKSVEAGSLYAQASKDAAAGSLLQAEKTRKIESEGQQAILRNRVDASRRAYEHEHDLAVEAGAAGKARDQFNEAERIANGARAKQEGGDFDGAAREYDAALAALRSARSMALQPVRETPGESPRIPSTDKAPGRLQAEPQESPQAAQEAIYSVPRRYKAAMEGKDLNLLRSIWPALGAQQEQAFRNQWAYTRSLRIGLEETRIEKIEGDSALVTVRLHNEQQMDDGTSRKWDQRATFSLSKKGSSWVIQSASFERLR
jgi:serine/threonine protein kinase/ketosteroid isomerase-like protein